MTIWIDNIFQLSRLSRSCLLETDNEMETTLAEVVCRCI